LAITLFGLCLGYLPFDSSINKGLALLVLIAVLWMSEALPIAITALLIPLLTVLLGIFPVKQALAEFSNPVLFLFLGGFALAAALRKQGLDRWIAEKILTLSRGHFHRAILSLFLITAAMSMWISNTATAAMMLPLALGLLQRLNEQSASSRTIRIYVLLGIAYSASIGGLGTLVGSPPNAIVAAEMNISFAQWMWFGMPLVAVLMPVMMIMLYLLLKPDFSSTENQQFIDEKNAPFNWTHKHYLTLSIFLLTVGLWIGSSAIAELFGNLDNIDTVIALLAIALLAISGVINWNDLARETDWGVLLLFGGGLTLGAALKITGSSELLVNETIPLLRDIPLWLIILLLSLLVIFLSELMSNTALTALLVPMVATLASSLDMSPVLLGMIIAASASFGFMLPVATPPNALVFATGQLPQKSMMRAGFFLNLLCAILLTLIVSAFH
jgi:sodium-dependent dicarboxylate transporter 2/3/5